MHWYKLPDIRGWDEREGEEFSPEKPYDVHALHSLGGVPVPIYIEAKHQNAFQQTWRLKEVRKSQIEGLSQCRKSNAFCYILLNRCAGLGNSRINRAYAIPFDSFLRDLRSGVISYGVEELKERFPCLERVRMPDNKIGWDVLPLFKGFKVEGKNQKTIQ